MPVLSTLISEVEEWVHALRAVIPHTSPIKTIPSEASLSATELKEPLAVQASRNGHRPFVQSQRPYLTSHASLVELIVVEQTRVVRYPTLRKESQRC